MGTGVWFFPHAKSKVKILTCFPYQKGRQFSYDGLVEMLMKAENMARILWFLKC